MKLIFTLGIEDEAKMNEIAPEDHSKSNDEPKYKHIHTQTDKVQWTYRNLIIKPKSLLSTILNQGYLGSGYQKSVDQ